MSHVWVLGPEIQWNAHRLDAASYDLHALFPPAVSGGSARPLDAGVAARMFSFHAGDAKRWVVVAGPNTPVRVNGVPLSAVGMRALGDRDEISIPGLGSTYYSAETLAEVVEFPGSDRAVFCGRCRQAIKPGSLAVKCPGCGIWYDQSPELTCWRYGDTCSFCQQTTALDAGFSWVPGD